MATRLVILGAGGHAKMVIEAARSQGTYEPTVCLAHGTPPQAFILGVPIESETEEAIRQLHLQGYAGFVAIGDNALRRKLCRKLEAMGMPLATIVSSRAWASPTARIEPGTVLMPGSVVGAESTIGMGAIVNTCASVDHDCNIAPFVHIAPGVHLAGNVHIGEAAFLGVGVSVIPERQIGAATTVGSGAVVITDIPNQEVWVGCPARFLKCVAGK